MSGSSNPISTSKQNPAEEIFSRLFFEGTPIEFVISKEETYEGEWVYRIYEPIPEPVKHKRISEMEYNRLRESMQRAAQAYNGFDALFARLQVNGLVRDWQFHWGNEYKAEFHKMGH